MLRFLDEGTFSEVELVVGDSLASLSKDALAASGVDVVDRLSEYVDSGGLAVYVSKKTLHTKLYVLSDHERVRVIQSSANLTSTARARSDTTNQLRVVRRCAAGPPILDTH